MSPLGFTVWLALQVFLFLMFGRLIFELVEFNKPAWRSSGILALVRGIVFKVTDLPLKLARKVIPNINLGATRLDLSWTVLALVVSIASKYAQYL